MRCIYTNLKQFSSFSPSQQLFGLVHVNVEDLNPVVVALSPAVGFPVSQAAVGVDVVRPDLEMIKHNLDLKQFLSNDFL